MARGSEARAAMVAGADLRPAEAGVPDRPGYADISRSDLSQPLHPDPRRSEERADGTFAYCTADAPRQTRQRHEWAGRNPPYGRCAAVDQPRPRIVLCGAVGRETFLPERTIRP